MILDKLPENILNALKACSDTASKNGIKIYLVGGVVRDLLLNRQTADIDVCLEFDAIEFAVLLEKSYDVEILQTQSDLRTAKVKFKNEVVLDLASTRTEAYPNASHLPVITGLYCTLNDDIKRRDFTVNSIAISLSSGTFGQIVDYLSGQKDLDNKKLRILHDKSFTDDPSRIIRALKYSVRLNLELEETTNFLMEEYLNNLPENICYSRIMAEIKLAFNYDCKLSLKKFLQWRLERLFNVQNVFYSLDLSEAFEKLNIISEPFTYFLSIFTDLDKDNLNKIFDTLNLDGRNKKILSDYLKLKNYTIVKEKIDIYNKFFTKEQNAIALYYAKTGNNDALLYKRELENIKIEVCGDDLIVMGIEPSKQFRTILNDVLKEKLEGRLQTKADEINFIKNYIKNS